TIVPMKLARLGNESLVSRSQAKRVILRFDRFSFVDLDFTGIPTIGQAFADEIFRVYANAHPELTLTYSHCAPEVEMMIRRARAHRE
ncbi:MAG TPA: STAS-like domain-containing protein, partial [Casimicrobium sp.]|nr:STAS-like domain-containing protein [Casimicrobium sp.]